MQVKAKYKARAKHFERKFQQMEQSNSRLVDELAGLKRALMLRGAGASQQQLHYHPVQVSTSLPPAVDQRTGIGGTVYLDVDAERDHAVNMLATPGDGGLATPLSPPSSLGEPSPTTVA